MICMDTLDQNRLDLLCECFLQTVHRFGELEKEAHTFGGEQTLHLSEVHTIVAIGSRDRMNMVTLSKLQGVSRSAVTQMVGRLAKKGFVKKEISPETENEVVLSLTEEGEQVCQWHERQHRWLREQLTVLFARYPDPFAAQLSSLMEKMQGLWSSIPEDLK